MSFNLSLELDSLKPNIKVVGFNIGWFSVGYKVGNDAFRLFNSKLGPSEQLQKQSFVSHEASIQYSRYNWSNLKSRTYFWLIGAGFNYSNNLNDLTKTEITEVKNYGATQGEKTSTSKYNVYEGAYKQDLKGLRLYGDFYKFLFSNGFALHGYGEAVYKTEQKPIYNAGLGFLISFKDTKDESSNVNAEIYYKFADLFKNSETDAKLFERNEIGIRFSFPITFKK